MVKIKDIFIKNLGLVYPILFLCVVKVWAARPYQPVHPDPILEPWRRQSFPELKGLGLQCLVQATDGTFWFGTDEGVRCYDGKHWKVYTTDDSLLGAPVKVLCATKDGNVYAGTDMGISRFNDRKWSRVFPPEGELPWLIDDLMEAKDGSIWAGTQWGALRLNKGSATLYTTKQMGTAMQVLAPYVRPHVLPDQVAPRYHWSEGIGVWVVRDFIWAVAPGGPGEAAGIRIGDHITAIDEKSTVGQDELVDGPAGTPVNLTVKRAGHPEPIEITVKRERVEGTFQEFPVYDVYEDQEGTIWFGLVVGEIVRYYISRSQPEHDTVWQLYTDKDGLGIGHKPRIIQTQDGLIWVVSDDIEEGVNRFDGKSWTNFHLSTLGGHEINPSVLETKDGTLWVGGISGKLHAFRGGIWTVYRTPEVPLPETRVVSLLEASDGALWVAGRGQEAIRLDYGTSRWTTYEGMNFQCETPDGAQWFLSKDNGVVRHDGTNWKRFGVEDGLIDYPVTLIATKEGEVWAAGSHSNTAATARFDGRRWSFRTHPQISWSIGRITKGAAYESSDGALWFGADVNFVREKGHIGGMLRFDGKSWIHYTPPGAPTYAYGIAQTEDSTLWVAGNRLRRFDGQKWSLVSKPKQLATSWSDAIYSSPSGVLWIGTRYYGVFCYDGEEWILYDIEDGLSDNSIRDIIQTEDGSIWITTAKGIDRFDGRNWTTCALPLYLQERDYRSLRQSRDGALWINFTLPDLCTIRYEPEHDPPETEITVSLERVSQPGNTILSWHGTDPWRVTPEEGLQYSWRLDEEKWSPFILMNSRVFLSLSSGEHIFEVKARDQDFNIDPTPANLRFVVDPPFWKQPLFLGMVVVLLSLVSLQTWRVIRRDRKLSESNIELQRARHDLEQRVKERTIELSKSLNEKEILLKEIHHRVKNNLQIISSLLSLQSRYIKGKQFLEMFRESQGRVRSMALIHDKLYQSQDLARVDFTEYVNSLVKSLYKSYEIDPRNINLKVNIKKISLGIDLAVPCGLIINELVSNALKHAFPSSWKGKGKIDISLMTTDDNEIEIIVRDNGIGIPEDIDIRKTESLGLHLVKILAEDQLQGKIKLERRKGTMFEIRFKGKKDRG